jgi:hypothetical protein
VVLSIENNARTLAPDTSQAVVELTFTPGAGVVDEDGDPATPKVVVYPTATTVSLEKGTWTLAARGYRSQAVYAARPSADEDHTYFAEYTQDRIIIRPGDTVEVTIRLSPRIDGTGLTGFFSWNITLGSDTVEASMTLTKADGTPITDAAGAAIPPLSSVSGTPPTVAEGTVRLKSASAPGSVINPFPPAPSTPPVSLPVGSYLLSVTLTNAEDQETGRIDAVHIYENMETRAAYTFDGRGYTSQVYLSGTITNPYSAYTPRRVTAFNSDGVQVTGQISEDIQAGSGRYNLYLPAFSLPLAGDAAHPGGSRAFTLKVYLQDAEGNGGYSKEIPVTLDLTGRTDLDLTVEKFTLGSS